MSATTLGIDIGSTNLKLCYLDGSDSNKGNGNGAGQPRFGIRPHDGDLANTLARLFDDLGIEKESNGLRALVTGAEGRHRLAVPEAIAAEAIEAGLIALDLKPRAVVSMGGEDLVVYVLDEDGQIVNTHAGNKCASGTGEFFRQQLGRMNLKIADLDEVATGACVHGLSSRCSVFMKSDCTHRLNKGESTKGDIALSLSKVMANKVTEFLIKARISSGQVVVIGGLTQNRFLIDFVRENWPDIELIVPEEAPYFEAFGAAQLAVHRGSTFERDEVISGEIKLSYGTFPSLAGISDSVTYMPSRRGKYDPNAEYVLGVDGGSTTTKVALVDAKTLEIVADYYGRTHGDPITAVRECLEAVKKQLGDAQPKISLVATTGSSRELLGVFLETTGVYNEIIAHTAGTTYFDPNVDTIFEIGGQDAKYVSINNGVPIDYAMNEACSAGTGSFLEESAQGDLHIQTAAEIGPIAMQSTAPLKFGEHCSAFINSDIRKGISQGAQRADIVAGLIFSIVANYLNRVVGNRGIGEHIILQGGVAKNPAIPLAFASMTGKKITVPPDPELMGCFGVARVALQKVEEGRLDKGEYSLDGMLGQDFTPGDSFVCKACDNDCDIRYLKVSGRRYAFGGRCSKYTNLRKKKKINEEKALDYTVERSNMLFEEYTPDPATFVARTEAVVGVPKVLSVHSLWPMYSTFFHTLGVRAVLSEKIEPEGIAKQESSYCYPVEIAHGAVQDILNGGAEYIFLPQFRDMPSMEKGDVHACLCPLTQGLPFLSRQAFGLDNDKLLRPVVSFKHGWDTSKPFFEDVAEQLGFSRREGAEAYDAGLAAYHSFWKAYRERGAELMREIEANPDRIYVALLGRPYNAFTRDANMGIPRKITSQGVTVVPFDMFYDPDAEIFPYMYWHYGQENMKAVRKVQATPNLFLTWISNFSCAPDSFLLHYVRWMMGNKPYLVLEIDSHTADAGLDTRVEAFLDIVDSYRHNVVPTPPREFARRYHVEAKDEYCDIVDNHTGERIDVRDERVTLVWPTMGDLSAKFAEKATVRHGVKSVHMPLPNSKSTQLARNVASGKECIPALLVLGSILEFFSEHGVNKPGEIYIVFVPITMGPCRTGQYHVFYDRLFEDFGWENVVIVISGDDNSYNDFGPTFSQDIWRLIVLGDYLTDVRTGIQLMAADIDSAMEVFDEAVEDIAHNFTVSTADLDKAVERAGQAIAKIPKRRTLEEIKKILVVGEIYVRRDPFSIKDLTEFLISKDIFPKTAGITEWIHYCDYARNHLLVQNRKRNGLLRVIQDGTLKEQAWLQIEKIWKRRVESKVRKQLMPTGFIPDAPHDMKKIIPEGGQIFIDPELESEACVSPAVAKAAMDDGYSGVAIVAPFGCLPGRLIEGTYAPWAKKRGYPVISLENDGQPYPPSIVARMEVFAHNVGRYEKSS